MEGITNKEALEIFKKYDPKLYEYYINNAHLMSYNARNYAEYLKKQNCCKDCEIEISGEYFDSVNGCICAECLKKGGVYYTLKKDGFIKVKEAKK